MVDPITIVTTVTPIAVSTAVTIIVAAGYTTIKVVKMLNNKFKIMERLKEHFEERRVRKEEKKKASKDIVETVAVVHELREKLERLKTTKSLPVDTKRRPPSFTGFNVSNSYPNITRDDGNYLPDRGSSSVS